MEEHGGTTEESIVLQMVTHLESEGFATLREHAEGSLLCLDPTPSPYTTDSTTSLQTVMWMGAAITEVRIDAYTSAVSWRLVPAVLRLQPLLRTIFLHRGIRALLEKEDGGYASFTDERYGPEDVGASEGMMAQGGMAVALLRELPTVRVVAISRHFPVFQRERTDGGDVRWVWGGSEDREQLQAMYETHMIRPLLLPCIKDGPWHADDGYWLLVNNCALLAQQWTVLSASVGREVFPDDVFFLPASLLRRTVVPVSVGIRCVPPAQRAEASAALRRVAAAMCAGPFAAGGQLYEAAHTILSGDGGALMPASWLR